MSYIVIGENFGRTAHLGWDGLFFSWQFCPGELKDGVYTWSRHHTDEIPPVAFRTKEEATKVMNAQTSKLHEANVVKVNA